MTVTTNTSLPTRIQQRLGSLPARWHVALAAAALAVQITVNAALDALYRASQFPVPFAQGQTTFDGALLKSYYATMLDAGTLDIYWATQLFDFVFIAAVIVSGFLAGSVIVRFAGERQPWRGLGLVVRTLIPLGAGFDAIENLISFTMLTQPRTFPEWIALPYSAAATIKFALVGVGLLALVVAVVGLAGTALVARTRGSNRQSIG